MKGYKVEVQEEERWSAVHSDYLWSNSPNQSVITAITAKDTRKVHWADTAE